MLSLKGLLAVSAVGLMAQPALAFNDSSSGPAAQGQYNPPATGQAPAAAPTQTCKVARPKLSPEERARRRALRAEREAEGLQRPHNVAHRDGPRMRPCG
jgi:hypothetical protein